MSTILIKMSLFWFICRKFWSTSRTVYVRIWSKCRKYGLKSRRHYSGIRPTPRPTLHHTIQTPSPRTPDLTDSDELLPPPSQKKKSVEFVRFNIFWRITSPLPHNSDDLVGFDGIWQITFPTFKSNEFLGSLDLMDIGGLSPPSPFKLRLIRWI